jgi:hypothetical protein
MKTVSDLIDHAKTTSGVASDYRLALNMGIQPARISNWRAEREFPPADHLLSLAEMAGEPVGFWLCIVQARKADRATMAHRWTIEAESISPDKTAA